MCHMYIKESAYAFIDLKLYGKAAFGYKRSRMYKKALIYSDGLPIWLKLWYVDFASY